MPKISLDLELNTRWVEQGMKTAEGYIGDTQKRLKSEKGLELTINLAKLRLELDKTNRMLKEAIKSWDESRMIKLKIDQEALKKEVTIANRALNNFINTGNQNYSALARMFDGVALTGGKLTGVLASMSPAAGGVIQSFSWMSSFAAGAGSGFAVLGASIGAVGVSLATASNIARSFEDAFTAVSKTVDGTQEQINALRQELIGMTKEIPLTFEELSSIAAVGGSLGIPIEQMGKFTNTVAKLSVAVDGLSGEQAATMLAKIGTVTGEGTANIDKMGSTLVALGNNFAATEGEILDFTNRIAASGTTLGVGSAELMAVSTAFTSLGLSAERGATAFSGSVNKIAVAVAGSTKELKDIALVSGMSVEQFKKSWWEDAFWTLIKFSEGLAKSWNEVKNIVDIFWTGAGEIETLQKLGREDGLLILKDALKTARHEANLMAGEVSALDKEAEKRFGTLSSQAAIMSNKWRAAFEPTGTMLNDTILKPLTKVLWDSASYFQLFIGILVIGFNVIKTNFSVGLQTISAFVKSYWQYMVDITKWLVTNLSAEFQAIWIVIWTWVKVAGLYFSQAGGYISQFVKNAWALFSVFSENIGIAFSNIWPLIWGAMNEMLKSVASWINKAIGLVNWLTEELKKIPLIWEKLAWFTKMWEVWAGSVDFGAVKQFKALPDLLKIDASKSAEIEATWANMYQKIWALKTMAAPTRKSIDELVDAGWITKQYADLDASIKKFADSQALAKAKVANAENAQKAKIRSDLEKKDIATWWDSAKWGGKGESDKTKKLEEELRKRAQLEIDNIKKSEDTEKEKALKIKAVKEKLAKDINDIQGKSLENEFDKSEKTLEEIEKAEKEKREAYKKTSNIIDDGNLEAIKKIKEHWENIEKLKKEYEKLAKDAGDHLRELNKELTELNNEKAQNQADTFNKLAERRVELLNEQKELEKDIAEAISKGGDEEDWKKINENQEKLVWIKKEIAIIDKTIPSDIAKQVEHTKSLTEAEQTLLELKKEQDEVDKKIETNRQKRLVDQAILNGGKILISGDGENIKAQVQDAKGIITDLTDFAAQEYAVDTDNKQKEVDAKIAIEKLAIDNQLLDLQNLDIARRELDAWYSIFFKSELDGRIVKLQEFIRVAREAAELASQAWVSSQNTAVIQASEKSATRSVQINNNISNNVDSQSVVRDITKKL